MEKQKSEIATSREERQRQKETCRCLSSQENALIRGFVRDLQRESNYDQLFDQGGNNHLQ